MSRVELEQTVAGAQGFEPQLTDPELESSPSMSVHACPMCTRGRQVLDRFVHCAKTIVQSVGCHFGCHNFCPRYLLCGQNTWLQNFRLQVSRLKSRVRTPSLPHLLTELTVISSMSGRR